MAAAAHDPEFAKSAGVPQSVAKDFNAKDAGTGILGKPKQSRADRRYAKSQPA